MTSASDLFIDTVSVRRLNDSGETAARSIQSQCAMLRVALRQAREVNGTHDKSDTARGFVNDVEDTVIDALEELNGQIIFVVDRIEDPPVFDDSWDIWIDGADTYVPLDSVQGLNTNWLDLREQDQKILLEHAPDIVLEMSNVPEAVRDAAERAWFDSVDSDAKVYGRELSIGVHVRVLWVDANVGLTYSLTEYADGSVRVEYMATGELGAAASAGVASIEAGVESSVLLAHRFGSMDEYERFQAQLKGEIASVDIDAVATMLVGKSCTSAVAKAGVYAGGQVGVGSGKIMSARLGVGVGRDWKTEENIFYMAGSVALAASPGGVRAGSARLGALASGQVDVVGERRKGVETDRVVLDISFETRASALGSLLGESNALVNNLRGTVQSDVEVTARLELDLEDLDTREAWDNFMDDKLGIADLFQYASLDGIISTSATGNTSLGGNVGLAAAQVTTSSTERLTISTFHKESGIGRPTRWLSKPEIERLSR